MSKAAAGVKKKSKLGGNDISFKFLILPSFILLFVLTIVPLIYSIVISLFDYSFMTPDKIRFVGFGNFIRAFEDSSFIHSLGVTAIQVVATVVLQMVCGMLFALLLSRDFRGAKLIRAIYIIPMMITPVVVGLMWRMLFNTDMGMINYLLNLVNIPAVNWLGEGNMALLTVILADVWLSTPFVATILLAGIQGISRDYYEAATVDGANAVQSFFSITLPLVKPMILIALLFRVMDAIKRFDSIYVMTAGGPGNSTETLNLYAYQQAFNNWYIGYSAALSFLMLIVIFALSAFILARMNKNN